MNSAIDIKQHIAPYIEDIAEECETVRVVPVSEIKERPKYPRGRMLEEKSFQYIEPTTENATFQEFFEKLPDSLHKALGVIPYTEENEDVTADTILLIRINRAIIFEDKQCVFLQQPVSEKTKMEIERQKEDALFLSDQPSEPINGKRIETISTDEKYALRVHHSLIEPIQTSSQRKRGGVYYILKFITTKYTINTVTLDGNYFILEFAEKPEIIKTLDNRPLITEREGYMANYYTCTAFNCPRCNTEDAINLTEVGSNFLWICSNCSETKISSRKNVFSKQNPENTIEKEHQRIFETVPNEKSSEKTSKPTRNAQEIGTIGSRTIYWQSVSGYKENKIIVFIEGDRFIYETSIEKMKQGHNIKEVLQRFDKFHCTICSCTRNRNDEYIQLSGENILYRKTNSGWIQIDKTSVCPECASELVEGVFTYVLTNCADEIASIKL